MEYLITNQALIDRYPTDPNQPLQTLITQLNAHASVSIATSPEWFFMVQLADARRYLET